MANLPPICPITRPLAFDAIAIGEIRIVDIGPQPRTMARWTYLNSKTGHTFAGGVCYTWSPRSIKLMQALAQSIANDIHDVQTLTDTPPDEDLDLDPTQDNALLHNEPDMGEAGWNDDDEDGGMRMG
jgi:hypothetical protein